MRSFTQLVGTTATNSSTLYPSSFTSLALNNTAQGVAVGTDLVNNEHRYLLQKYFSNEGTYTFPTVSQQQTYKLPPNYSKLKTITITIGNLKWTPTEILTREEWDKLNVFPYYADIPSNYFIYNNQIQIWPIPSTTGNTITINYKYRVADLSLADTSAGTVSIAPNTTTVTGIGTGWIPTVNTNSENRWIQFSSPTGDNLWYQVQSVNSPTSITLYDAYYGTTAVSGGNYVLGQMPLLIEDFHDMLVYGALKSYFSTIVLDEGKFKNFDTLYNTRLELLAEYAGTKTIHVNLGRRQGYMNPNLFGQTFG